MFLQSVECEEMQDQCNYRISVIVGSVKVKQDRYESSSLSLSVLLVIPLSHIGAFTRVLRRLLPTSVVATCPQFEELLNTRTSFSISIYPLPRYGLGSVSN